MNEPLLGVRVIDFGQYVAGPLAAMLLGDHGAEVIRIDPPGGPRLVTPANATWQRGKQSRVLDLQRDADRATAQQLIASADVVIENFRPGVMDRLGLGAAAMRAAHPGLIYCSLPGFASDDPRAGLAAWEGVVGAATDTYRRSVGSTGGSTNSGRDQPVYVGIPIASNFAAFQAANAITAALIARQRGGLGQRIEVPLFDAMFTAIGARAMRVPFSNDPILDNIGFGVYVCADGRCVHFAPVAPRFMDWFVDAVGIAAWCTEGLFDRARLNAEPALVAELRRRLTLLFAQRTALDWETLGDTIGVPIAVCRSMAEWAHTGHAGASATIVELDDPQHGRMRLPGAAVRLSGPPERALVARRPLDADRDTGGFVRPRAAAGPTPKSSIPPSTTPSTSPATSALAGLRVLDLTQIWAGPTAARALAEYGADVIKINSPHEPVMTHVDVNRGKRTVLLDLAAPQDLAVFWRLLDTADVVMQNFRFGAAERLGVGYEQVRARRPDIIYASISAYGSGGPWRARRGYEVQGQAVAGAQDQFGGDAAAQRLPYEINDYGTGVLGAFAVLLAQHHRLRTGEGQHVEAALTYTATLHQSMHLQDFVGKEWTEPRGQNALGSGPLQRLYRASDGWFFLGARESGLAALARIDGLAGIAELRGERLALFLEHAVLTRPVAHWVERFNAAGTGTGTGTGTGAHALIPVQQLVDDAWVRAHGLVITRDHVGVGSVTTTGPVARLSRTPLRPGHPVLPPGADLAEVLRELELHELESHPLGRRESSSPAPAH